MNVITLQVEFAVGNVKRLRISLQMHFSQEEKKDNLDHLGVQLRYSGDIGLGYRRTLS